MTTLKPSLALFDFDNTLTNRDTFLPFVQLTHSQKDYWLGLFKHGFTVLAYLLGWCPNEVIKELLLIEFYQGWLFQDIQHLAVNYADQFLPNLIDQEALQQLKWHQSEGHVVVLVSAALAIYLSPWGTMMQIDYIIGNELETEEGYITGKLKGKNCYGLEKVKRLEAVLGDLSSYYIYAYGDSHGDHEMLAVADEAYYRKFGNQQQTIVR